MAAILGRKLGMTQIFDAAGNIVPVTVVEAGPCVVVGVRTPEREGYAAVQLGFDPLREKPRARAPQKPYRGMFAKRGLAPMKVIREVRIGAGETFEIGQAVRADVFSEGARVDVTGVSKGKGFAGAIKRHNFGGQRDSHGVSLMHRAIGSIGSSNIARVWKGKRMPGLLGGGRSTVKGVRVVSVDLERNVLLIRGALPGPRGGVVLVKSVRLAGRRAAAAKGAATPPTGGPAAGGKAAKGAGA
jgi:large subunit ribosomal protein L3